MESWSSAVIGMDSFDLLLFRGNDAVSNLIVKLQKRQLHITNDIIYSHVGLVIDSSLLPSYNLKPGKYVLESTFSYAIGGQVAVPDAITSQGCFGVQLRSLDELIPAYLGQEGSKIAWCPLRDEFRENLNVIGFEDTFKKWHGTPYEFDIQALLAGLYPCCRPYRDMWNTFWQTCFTGLSKIKCLHVDPRASPGNWQFCSEFTARILQSVGVSTFGNPCDAVPMDFLGYDQDGMPKIVREVIPLKL